MTRSLAINARRLQSVIMARKKVQGKLSGPDYYADVNVDLKTRSSEQYLLFNAHFKTQTRTFRLIEGEARRRGREKFIPFLLISSSTINR